jgi:alpha-tubulin suppressor-like RCC1 family protein
MADGSDALAALADLQDDYEIVREIGRGGTAVVYLARDRALQRDAAIKVILPQFTSDAEAVARFAREARTVARFDHPNIVTIHAVRRLRDGNVALVMQYVPGVSVAEALAHDGPFDAARARRVLTDVAEALAYAHAQGVVHRDVKPENIFLDQRTGQARLSDFGIARTIAGDGTVAPLTMANVAIGTPAYMSPEQLDGSPIDGRSDVYSLALVGWEMLAGRRPWQGETLYGLIYRQKHDQLAPLDVLRPELPRDLVRTIEVALSKDPRERWACAEHFAAALNGQPAPLPRRRARPAPAAPPLPSAPTFYEPVPTEVAEATTMRWLRTAVAAARVGKRAPKPAAPAGADVAAPETRSVGPATLTVRRYAPAITAAALVATLAAALSTAARPAKESRPPRRAPATAPNVDAPRSTPVGVVSDSAARASSDTADRPSVQPLQRAVQGGETGVARGDGERPRTSEPHEGPPVATTAASPASDSSTRAAPDSGSTGVVRGADGAKTDSAPGSQSAAANSEGVAIEAGIGAGGAGVVSPRGAVVALAPGGGHTCELTANGLASCWGGNERGQLGDGTTDRRAVPAPVSGGLHFAGIAAGLGHTCAVTKGGAAYCWGRNDRGQLGDGTREARAKPSRVASRVSFRTVLAGAAHSCAIARSGEAYCWGSNASGQLGARIDGSVSAHPVRVRTEARFLALAVGWNHTCGLTERRNVGCWGQNAAGQLGDGTHTDRAVPQPVAGERHFAGVAAGAFHSCALADGTGELYCWGRNDHGQLGTGGTVDRPAPAPVVGNLTFVQVIAGSMHTCALTAAGNAYCWGANGYGQLGDGTTEDRATPVRVQSGGSFLVRLWASGSHTCAITSTGSTLCWGYNLEGQLGDGTRSHRARPVAAGPPTQ